MKELSPKAKELQPIIEELFKKGILQIDITSKVDEDQKNYHIVIKSNGKVISTSNRHIEVFY